MTLTFIVLFDPTYFPCTYTQECFVSAFGKDQWFDKEYRCKKTKIGQTYKHNRT